MRVLVIDDDAAVREMIRTLLCREGFEIVGTGHGPGAVEVIDGADVESYAAIVLQVNATPSRLDAQEATGIALLNHIRRQKPHLISRVVVSTTMPRLSEAGCTIVMQPFDIQEFVEAVRHCATRTAGGR